jgi:hypothetical protein
MIRWVVLALLGLLVAGAVSYGASRLASQPIGLSAEPPTAGGELVAIPTPARTPKPLASPKPTPTATPVDDHGNDPGDDHGHDGDSDGDD